MQQRILTPIPVFYDNKLTININLILKHTIKLTNLGLGIIIGGEISEYKSLTIDELLDTYFSLKKRVADNLSKELYLLLSATIHLPYIDYIAKKLSVHNDRDTINLIIEVNGYEDPLINARALGAMVNGLLARMGSEKISKLVIFLRRINKEMVGFLNGILKSFQEINGIMLDVDINPLETLVYLLNNIRDLGLSQTIYLYGDNIIFSHQLLKTVKAIAIPLSNITPQLFIDLIKESYSNKIDDVILLNKIYYYAHSKPGAIKRTLYILNKEYTYFVRPPLINEIHLDQIIISILNKLSLIGDQK